MNTPTRLAEVTTLYASNMRDIPAMLRRLADEVEKGVAGEHGHRSHQSANRYAHLYPKRVQEVMFAVGKRPQTRRKIADRPPAERPRKQA